MMPHLIELERVLEGEVIPSGSPAFRELRRPFNALFDIVEPQVVVRCASDGDVAERSPSSGSGASAPRRGAEATTSPAGPRHLAS